MEDEERLQDCDRELKVYDFEDSEKSNIISLSNLYLSSTNQTSETDFLEPTSENPVEDVESTNTGENQRTYSDFGQLFSTDADNNNEINPPLKPQKAYEFEPLAETSFLKILVSKPVMEVSDDDMSCDGLDSSRTKLLGSSHDSKVFENYSSMSSSRDLIHEMERSFRAVQRKKDFRLKQTSTSSFLFTVHVDESYVKSDSDVDVVLLDLHEMQAALEQDFIGDYDELDEDGVIVRRLRKDYPNELLEKRCLVAWKLSQLYTRNKKTVTDTRIPLTATLMFTRRISGWTRFVRRLRSFSLFMCCSNMDEMADSMTRTDSVDAFHNEVRSLGIEERPTGSLIERRRNISEATNAIKIVQQRHNSDKSKKSRSSNN